jgi:hypothetical protein
MQACSSKREREAAPFPERPAHADHAGQNIELRGVPGFVEAAGKQKTGGMKEVLQGQSAMHSMCQLAEKGDATRSPGDSAGQQESGEAAELLKMVRSEEPPGDFQEVHEVAGTEAGAGKRSIGVSAVPFADFVPAGAQSREAPTTVVDFGTPVSVKSTSSRAHDSAPRPEQIALAEGTKAAAAASLEGGGKIAPVMRGHVELQAAAGVCSLDGESRRMSTSPHVQVESSGRRNGQAAKNADGSAHAEGVTDGNKAVGTDKTYSVLVGSRAVKEEQTEGLENKEANGDARKKRRCEGGLLKHVCTLANAPRAAKEQAVRRLHAAQSSRKRITELLEERSHADARVAGELHGARTVDPLTETVEETLALLEAVESATAPNLVSDQLGRVTMGSVRGRERKKMPDGWLELVAERTGLWKLEAGSRISPEEGKGEVGVACDNRGEALFMCASNRANFLQYSFRLQGSQRFLTV